MNKRFVLRRNGLYTPLRLSLWWSVINFTCDSLIFQRTSHPFLLTFEKCSFLNKLRVNLPAFLFFTRSAIFHNSKITSNNKRTKHAFLLQSQSSLTKGRLEKKSFLSLFRISYLHASVFHSLRLWCLLRIRTNDEKNRIWQGRFEEDSLDMNFNSILYFFVFWWFTNDKKKGFFQMTRFELRKVLKFLITSQSWRRLEKQNEEVNWKFIWSLSWRTVESQRKSF